MKARSLSLPFCQEVPLPTNIRIAPFFKKSRRLPSIAAGCPFCKQRRSWPLLPVAVAVGYLHQGCGFPAVFAVDMFQACLASCWHKPFMVLVGLLIWLLCAPPTQPSTPSWTTPAGQVGAGAVARATVRGRAEATAEGTKGQKQWTNISG